MEAMKDFITRLAENAGNIALEYLGKAKISSKGEKDIVTEADKAVEKYILKKINENFPSHNTISEESGNDGEESDFVWYIDPIDGTNNFSHGDPNFCISIALAEKGIVKYGCVYIPMLKEMYFAEKGKGAELNGKKIAVSKVNELDKALMHIGIRPLKQELETSLKYIRYFALFAERVRDYGFAAGELAFVAAGRADASLKLNQHVWDIAAGILIIEEAGGKVTDLHGNEIKLDKIDKYNIVVSNNLLHKIILTNLKTI